MNVSEKVCLICGNSNELEAIACWNCGALLEDPFLDPGAKTKTTDMPALDPGMLRDWPIDEAAIPAHGIAVYLKGISNPAYVDVKGEFVIGRKVEETSEDLLDLAPWGGYHLGLSRRHAIIRRTADGYEVLDLGSVNGTWLNQERLTPQRSYPLPSGSHLRLGSMQLFVLYRSDETR